MESQEAKSNRNLLIAAIATIIFLLIGAFIYFSTTDEPGEEVATEEPSPDSATTKQTDELEVSSADIGGNTEDAVATDLQEVETEVARDPAPAPELEIDIVRVEATGEVIAAGRFAPNSTVSMAAGGKVYGKTKANHSGEWAIVFEESLPPGSYLFQIITQLDENSDEVVQDTEITILIPENPNEEPLVALNKGGAATEVLQIPGEVAESAPETGTIPALTAETKTEVVLETDVESESGDDIEIAAGSEVATGTEVATETEAAADSLQETETSSVEEEKVEEEIVDEPQIDPSFVTIRAVEVEEGKVFVAGEGNKDAAIAVFVNDEFLGHATPNAQGRWLLEAEMELEAGTHDITARVMDTSTHTVIAAVTVKFEKEADSEILIPHVEVTESGASGTAGASTIVRMNAPRNVIIRRGDNLWRISRRLYGRGIRYTTIYEVNKDQIDDPDLIFPGQIFITPKRDLKWTD